MNRCPCPLPSPTWQPDKKASERIGVPQESARYLALPSHCPRAERPANSRRGGLTIGGVAVTVPGRFRQRTCPNPRPAARRSRSPDRCNHEGLVVKTTLNLVYRGERTQFGRPRRRMTRGVGGAEEIHLLVMTLFTSLNVVNPAHRVPVVGLRRPGGTSVRRGASSVWGC
jgi:hypothetical protein